MMECGNLLQDNDMLIFHDYETFDIKKEKEHFEESSRLTLQNLYVYITEQLISTL